MDEERMLTVAEVAERLRVHQQTVREWLRLGKIKGARLGGTKMGWRIPEDEILRFLNGEQTGAVLSPSERYAQALQRLASQCRQDAAAALRGDYPHYPREQIDDVRIELEALLLAMAKRDMGQRDG